MRRTFEDLAFLAKLALVAAFGLWLSGARAAEAPAPTVTATTSPAPAR
jgi:hypothetical protein